MQQINEEIEDHPWHPENIGWLRRGVKLRVSGRRLRKLAARYLAIQMTTPAPWNLVTSARTVNAANPRRERELQDSDFVGVDRAAPALNADTLSGREEFTKPPAPTTQRQQTPC